MQWLLSLVGIDSIKDIIINLIATSIGIALGYFFKRLTDWRKKRKINKVLISFLGSSTKSIYVLHSAINDPTRSSYNIPYEDVENVTKAAVLLYKTGKEQDKDFDIVSENKLLDQNSNIEIHIRSRNIISICGPKRSAIVNRLLSNHNKKLRYEFKTNDLGIYYIYDHQLGTNITSSRDNPEYRGNDDQYDYGLIISMPNPLNNECNVVLFTGIHGIGSRGAIDFISDPINMERLCNERKKGIIQALVKVDYQNNSHIIDDIILVGS
ncbi:MAG: hypothetical protein LCH85_09560 [Chloroflexi bacterium]|nr:hypothetical protein [Chloroflexota bacterium]